MKVQSAKFKVQSASSKFKVKSSRCDEGTAKVHDALDIL